MLFPVVVVILFHSLHPWTVARLLSVVFLVTPLLFPLPERNTTPTPGVQHQASSYFLRFNAPKNAPSLTEKTCQHWGVVCKWVWVKFFGLLMIHMSLKVHWHVIHATGQRSGSSCDVLLGKRACPSLILKAPGYLFNSDRNVVECQVHLMKWDLRKEHIVLHHHHHRHHVLFWTSSLWLSPVLAVLTLFLQQQEYLSQRLVPTFCAFNPLMHHESQCQDFSRWVFICFKVKKSF